MALPAYQLVLRTSLMKRPVIACAFSLPTATAVDARLVAGSALFGAGVSEFGAHLRCCVRMHTGGVQVDHSTARLPCCCPAGWGMTGICPGPALVSLVTLQPLVLLFVSCMAVGWKLESLVPGPGKAVVKAAI